MPMASLLGELLALRLGTKDTYERSKGICYQVESPGLTTRLFMMQLGNGVSRASPTTVNLLRRPFSLGALNKDIPRTYERMFPKSFAYESQGRLSPGLLLPWNTATLRTSLPLTSNHVLVAKED